MRAHLAIPLALLLSACGPSSGGDTGGDDDSEDPGDGDGDPITCDNASDCSADQVCNPADDMCASDVPCSVAADCGNGALCEGGGCVPNGTGGQCADTSECPTGETCDEGHCGCDAVAFHAEAVKPNMLIVLDKSVSMLDPVDCDFFSCTPSKWSIAKTALRAILDDFGPGVRFGLDLFASNNDCSAGSVVVDIGDGTAPTIQTRINNTSPNSNTPIVASMAALVGNPSLMDPDRPNYIMLVTDGGESCDDWSTQGVTQLRNQTPEVKTFVVGFGGGVVPAQLNAMAVEGGTARTGTTKYYKADSAAQLSDAFESIVGSVLSCSYALDQVPEEVDDLYVFGNGELIDRDPVNGWDYDPDTNTVTLYGAACDELQSGETADLKIVYGCPDPDVE